MITLHHRFLRSQYVYVFLNICSCMRIQNFILFILQSSWSKILARSNFVLPFRHFRWLSGKFKFYNHSTHLSLFYLLSPILLSSRPSVSLCFYNFDSNQYFKISYCQYFALFKDKFSPSQDAEAGHDFVLHIITSVIVEKLNVYHTAKEQVDIIGWTPFRLADYLCLLC